MEAPFLPPVSEGLFWCLVFDVCWSWLNSLVSASSRDADGNDVWGRLPPASWTGVLAPAGTPAPLVSKLNAAVNDGLRSPEISANFAKFSAEAKIGSPQDFADFIAEEEERREDVHRASPNYSWIDWRRERTASVGCSGTFATLAATDVGQGDYQVHSVPNRSHPPRSKIKSYV